jgi:hypothetical protein
MPPKREMAKCLLLVALLAAPCADAAVVVVKGSTQPVVGYLVRQDERSVTLREVLPGGKSRESSFARSNIDELIITVSPERLGKLEPVSPADYLEYAEELAEKQRDPEARETALRLYAIAAARGDGSRRYSAMLGLIALARSPGEERKLRAAAYLFGADHDESLLKNNSAGMTAPQSLASVGELLTALRLVRQGKSSQARAILEKPALRNDAPRLAGFITLDELAELSNSSQLSNQQLTRVLRAEIALEEAKLGRTASGESSAGRQSPWSSVLRPGSLAPMPLLTLETLTEFNPAECVFRNGKWVRP